MALARRRTARGPGRFARVAGVVLALGMTAAGCAVDSSGVIRAAGDGEGDVVIDGEDAAADECAALLARLQEDAVELVGPNGFVGVTPAEQFDPRFGGFGIAFEGGFGFGIGQPGGAVRVGESAVSVGEKLAVARDGRLYVLSPEDGAVGSVWLDALPGPIRPAPETALLPRDDELVAVSPSVPLRDEAGDPYLATVIQRVDISDPSAPAIIERLSIRGDVAGATATDGGVRVAVAVPPPALDFLFPSTAGGEDAAREHNQELLASTVLGDWLGGYELTQMPPGAEPTTTTGVLGGCDVVSAEGADAAVGATVLIDLGADGSLADLDATTLLGQGKVSFAADATYLLSPRSHAVGFVDPGRQGSPRVVVTRFVEGEGGPVVDSVGIMAGALSTLPTISIGDDRLVVFTSTFDQFTGEGGVSAAVLASVDGAIRPVDTTALPVQPWETLTLTTVDDTLVVSGQQSSAVIDVSDPTNIDVSGAESRFDEGGFVGAPQFAAYGGGAVLRVDQGQVVQEFGGIDNFIQNLEFGGFGDGWAPWNEAQTPASIDIVEGDPVTGAVIAGFEAPAFALWPLTADSDTGEIVVGVIGLRTEGDEPFDGALVLRREGDRLVETDRWSLDRTLAEDFGATECEKLRLDGNILDVIGLWNQTPLRCDAGVPGGMVGHSCTSLTIPEISAQDLRNWFGFENTDILDELEEVRAAEADGSHLEACMARPAGLPAIVRGLVSDTEGPGRWLIGPGAAHRVDADGQLAAPLALEPPYTT